MSVSETPQPAVWSRISALRLRARRGAFGLRKTQEQGNISEFRNFLLYLATFTFKLSRDFRGLRVNSLLVWNTEFKSADQGRKFARSGKEIPGTGIAQLGDPAQMLI